jgi:uncharacterized metal-binding protein YceD (DUF177 family)
MSPIYEIDLSALPEEGETYNVSVNQLLCKETTARFNIPNIYDISIEMNIKSKGYFWELTGNITAGVQLKCAHSSDLFDAGFQTSFKVVLSTRDIDDETLDVEIIEGSTVDIGDIAIQYLALAIPLTPIHPKINDDITEITGNHETAPVTPTWKKALEDFKQQK